MNKINRLGFVLSQMGPNQVCYDIIRASNEYLSHNDDIDISLFWCNDGPRPLLPKFACMNLFEAFGYNGNVVGTNLHTINRVLSYPGPNRNKIFYYVYDLDWLRIPNKQYEQLSNIYMNPKVNLVVRSENHREIIESCWKKCIGVVEYCDINKFKELL